MISRFVLMALVVALSLPMGVGAGLPRDIPPGSPTERTAEEAAKPEVDKTPSAVEKTAATPIAPVVKPKPVVEPLVPDVVATEPVAVPETPVLEVIKVDNRSRALPRRPLTAVAAVGKSDGNVEAVMIALDYHFDWLRQIGRNGYINPYSELLLGYWEGEEGHTGVSSLHEAGLSLLLRYRYIRGINATFHPYVDAGFGMHYLTEDRIEGKELGRHWQAGSNIGIGLMFPRSGRCELGLRLRHLSNAGTDEFNWGVNQLLARFGVRF